MELELDSHRSLPRLTPPDAFVLAVGPLVMELRAQGLSYERLATELASRDVPESMQSCGWSRQAANYVISSLPFHGRGTHSITPALHNFACSQGPRRDGRTIR